MPTPTSAPTAALGPTPTNRTPMAVLTAAGLAGLAATAAPANAQGPLQEPFPAVLKLADVDGVIGFRLSGAGTGERSGFSVAPAGDVNGDGIDDLIIGARFARPGGRLGAGASYIVFGRDAVSGPAFPADFSLAAVDGVNGFRVDGASSGDRSGSSVAAAGDVNGDGVGDIIIGASWANPGGRSNAGSSFVVFGRDTASGATFPAAIQLADLGGENGFRMDGVMAWDYSAASVASAGDINGDGVDDVIVGAERADGAREAVGGSYVVFGRDVASSGAFPATIQLAALDGVNGFLLHGARLGDASGTSVAPAGDVNGDGRDDLIIGAPGTDPGVSSGAGSSYVFYGRDAASGAAFPARIGLVGLGGVWGFRMEGVSSRDRSGSCVASAGDVNGDGVDDVIIGAPTATPEGRTRAGSSYVVFGRDTTSGPPFPDAIALADLDGSNGFRLDGVDTLGFSGWSVASAGDINGDGVDDVIIGAYRARPDGAGSGASYVVFGRDTASGVAFPPTIDLASLDGTNGFRLDGVRPQDNSGRSVASAGDINGDGVDDLIVGSDGFDLFGNLDDAGASYVIYGRDLSGAACRADLDGDGELTIFDFLAFQNLFDGMDPRADFDGDGALTIFDFLAFQNAFNAGCM